MRRTTVLLAAAATALLALPLPASAVPPARAAAAAGPVLTSVTLSTGAVSVSGLDTVPVTVTVTATGDQGACPGNAGGVTFRRTNVHVWDRSATRALLGPLSCVSDNGGVRTYKATVPVPSTADGPWRVDAVAFGNDFHDPRSFDLPDATLDVTGTHRPRLRIAVAPRPLVYPSKDVTVTVQASYDDTREPIITRWISVTDDGGSLTGCGECPGNTDTSGRLVRRLTLTDSRSLIADMPMSTPGFGDFWASYSTLSAPVLVQPVLSAAASAASVRHGTTTSVDGHAVASALPYWWYYASPSIEIDLQRLVGRHWRTVSRGVVRSNGRFTLLATPPEGRNYYRVSLPAQENLAATTSRTFVIRGTR
jgi:hypothetical protein